jgi:hypothetical protein
VGLCEKVAQLQRNLNKVVSTVASLKEDVARIKRCLDSLAPGKRHAYRTPPCPYLVRVYVYAQLNASRVLACVQQ